jgi:heme/copper-type cytochrome/quinol oxidase subunit 2
MRRFAFLVGLLAVVVFGGTLPAQACATCFGASDSPMAQGMNLGILSLLGVIGFVLVGVVAFFVYLAWRVSRYEASNLDDEIPGLGESTPANWQ